MDDNFADDSVIQALIREATADADVIGFILTGSRAIGATGPDSDYDVVFVVTDEALARYGETKISPLRGSTLPPLVSTKDMWHEAPRSLQLETIVAWMLPTWAEARILYDRNGETERIFTPLRFMTPARSKSAVADFYDDYLNGFFRSLKCWRQGNTLGGRLEAAQSTDSLLNMLFALEQRWRPYSSRLIFHLHHLARQGWQPGELDAILLDLISTGNPTRQQALMRRIAALLAERGFAHVYDDWEGQIDQALGWVFAE
ncbi:MAG: hypothetical protein KDE19_01685 [Caldilineaceae bacterium]|nr:hypothetical protein [Caldilineaceae bacterium]